ncbi:MAG TPA: DUF4157 domain-containing protein [Kofleriaceae bacterium]|nr:DUF4157 domain-containing protein [Kofleriaceae bacterium]
MAHPGERWLRPRELDRAREGAELDLAHEARRHGLALEQVRALWDRAQTEATDTWGRCDAAGARAAFHRLVRGARSDVGRRTLVEAEAARWDTAAAHDGATAAAVPDGGADTGATTATDAATAATATATATAAAPGCDAEVTAAARAGVAEPGGALPHLDVLQRAFGAAYDLSAVEAHVGGAAARASARIGANGYAFGRHVAFASFPSLFLAAHEAAHVVQQRTGGPRTGGVDRDGDDHEHHADTVAAHVVSGMSVAHLFGGGTGASSVAVQRRRRHAAVDPALIARAQQDATALATALMAEPVDEAAARRVLGLDAAALARVRDAYNIGSRNLTTDVLGRLAAGSPLRRLAVGQLTRAGLVDTSALTEPADLEAGARHDGGEGMPLGQGDDVWDADGHVIVVFPATAEGVVQAAFYELHRGRERSLEDILHDDTAERTTPGAHVAHEGSARVAVTRADGTTGTQLEGTNTDIAGSQPIGHRGRRRTAIGPVDAYLRSAGRSPRVPWCGSFATFIYLRCGLIAADRGATDSMAASHEVPDVMARLGDADHPGAYHRFTGDEHHHGHARTYDGDLQDGEHSADGASFPSTTSFATALAFDIRPGDVFWMEHDRATGHVGIIVGVHRTEQEVTMVMIEGNADNQVRTRTRYIRVAAAAEGTQPQVTSDIKGWGRPPGLQGGAPVETGGTQPAWMTAAAAQSQGEGTTR